MNTAVPKVDLRSLDITEEKRTRLRELFPEVFTEGDKIDFDRLKLTLGESVDVGKERYGMNWSGKADCFKTIQQPSVATLIPVRDESVNFDTTDNVFIEGDNLEVLKLLQKSYFGKVKMIYIDPPYNTGNDFIYPDNYAESLETYLRYTGQVDAEGRRFSTNTEADGRFHSKWLNMMYPRLFLARNLLREDGVLFVTIDDQELDNLRKIGNDVFGEENFVTCVAWQKKVSPANDAKWFSSDHDYVVVFAKSKAVWRPNRLERNERQTGYYKNPDNDPRGPWNSATYTCNKTKEERPNLYYPITNPNTHEEIWPKETAVWKYSKDVSDTHLREKKIFWGTDGESSKPRLKVYLNEVDNVVPRTVWSYDEVGHTQEATQELQEILPDSGFDTPKPLRLIRRMLSLATRGTSSDIVLDFFAGSGSTGHAVFEANADDKGNRKFILVQLPEPVEASPYKNIADICKERLRRAIAKLDSHPQQQSFGDSDPKTLGFRTFRLSSSNFRMWNPDVARDAMPLVNQLEMHVDHVVHGRTQDDILFELLLKSGFPLSTSIEPLNVAGKRVFSVAEGALLICIDKGVTHELIVAMADMKPERVVCLDEGFAGNDQLKTNAVQTMKVKNVTSFRTV